MTTPSQQPNAVRCAYDGCRASFPIFDANSEAPTDWYAALMLKATPLDIQTFLGSANVLDAMLCPPHAQEILAIVQAGRPGCAYRGCINGFAEVDPQPAISEGWRWLLMGTGDLLNPDNVLRAKIDGFLCPRHVEMFCSQFSVYRS